MKLASSIVASLGVIFVGFGILLQHRHTREILLYILPSMNITHSSSTFLAFRWRNNLDQIRPRPEAQVVMRKIEAMISIQGANDRQRRPAIRNVLVCTASVSSRLEAGVG